MAMTTCPECKREISEYASCCPHCGAPIKQNANEPSVPKPTKPAGCALQVVGGIFAICGVMMMAAPGFLSIGILSCLIGIGLLWWGRQAL